MRGSEARLRRNPRRSEGDDIGTSPGLVLRDELEARIGIEVGIRVEAVGQRDRGLDSGFKLSAKTPCTRRRKVLTDEPAVVTTARARRTANS